ncbi:hypothetical protein [Macellibacteroides fermentans]|uniref:hypothetical protein n=1 Tax=Macellibacteroides fermentans TaxID=879969 RepID=UPI00406C881E
MYSFTQLSNISNKGNEIVPFVEKGYINFLVMLKGIKPVYLEISDESGSVVGCFIGGIIRFIGIKVLGSPFWGWMGQHMGFTLYSEVNKTALVDDLLDYAFNQLKVGYVQLCSFNIDFLDIKDCKHKLITGEQYTTCYINLTHPVEVLQKNLKSGYRTSIRKFGKDGGIIVEDYSDNFIEEHHRQLDQVFVRNNLKTPNYRKKMNILFNSPEFEKGVSGKLGVYSIKAILPIEKDGVTENKCIASSYYIHNGYMAMFSSNASYSEYLRSCPNQALTWHAMMAFKEAGIHYLDMGGSGSYKLNFSGGGWEPKPIIICSKNTFNYFVILGLKRSYGKISTAFGKARNWIKKSILLQSNFGKKVYVQNSSNQSNK